jgi:hypothetical protein
MMEVAVTHTNIERKQVNIRVETALYRLMETIARRERRSVPQTARLLLEEALAQRLRGESLVEGPTAGEIAALATAGGAFDWLADEPDLYDDTCGESV